MIPWPHFSCQKEVMNVRKEQRKNPNANILQTLLGSAKIVSINVKVKH